MGFLLDNVGISSETSQVVTKPNNRNISGHLMLTQTVTFVANLTQNRTGCCIAACLPQLENTTKKLSSILMSLIAC